MNPAELLKERGNDAFKSAAFEKAIELYGEAIEACSDKPGSALALSCYNNRAACNQQLSNFSGVIRDCTHVLEYDEKNQKALLRRALAYEGLERYRLALQDIRALLAINPSIEVRCHSFENQPYRLLTWIALHFTDCQQSSAPSQQLRSSAEAEQLIAMRSKKPSEQPLRVAFAVP
ncbi:unnamed protein product [Phytophthora fragariaefolia]|uniref:Unnamed protein product n=1 Tax=Phytophthora fragariaefolia TaxID=1490495 RepID=A0A9W7CY68_9STRA|nr:unnamed protein product [Phytophthora fragariaefolia]